MKNNKTAQTILFPFSWQQLKEMFDIDFFQVQLLFTKGYLSFNPAAIEALNTDDELLEISFLKTLCIDTGLPDFYLKAMLEKLERPYIFSLDKIFWDFRTGSWVQFDDLIEDLKDDWLYEQDKPDISDLIQECEDTGELEDLISSIVDRLVDLRTKEKR